MTKPCKYCGLLITRRKTEGSKTWEKRQYHQECRLPAIKKLKKGFFNQNNIVVKIYESEYI